MTRTAIESGRVIFYRTYSSLDSLRQGITIISPMEGDRPKVGIGIIVKRGNKILLGERLSNHGAGTFEIPGGHLEFGETFEEAAKREVLEETGLQDITLCGVVSIGNDILYDKHYVSIGLLAECHSGESYDAEPEHSRNWRWYALDKLPVPVFPHSQRVIDNWLSGKIYTDSNLITSHV